MCFTCCKWWTSIKVKMLLPVCSMNKFCTCQGNPSVAGEALIFPAG